MEESQANKVLGPIGEAQKRVLAFAAGLAAIAGGMAGGLLYVDMAVGALAPVAALCGLAFIAERQSVRLSSTTELSVAFLPLVFAAVVFGPLAAMAVGAAGFLSQFGRPYTRWVVWTTSRALVGGAAGLAALAVGGPQASSFGRLLAASIAASAAEVVVDLGLGGATVTVRRSGSFWNVVRAQGYLLLSALPFYAPVIALLAYGYKTMSPWSVALFLVPAFIAQRLYALYREERKASKDLEAANERLGKANLSFATALVATLDARDRYTAGHSAAVAIYARDIAIRMALPEERQALVHLCGLVHDIGKIGLPAGLLEKRGPMTLEERRQMEQHSAIGERILAKVDDYGEIARIVRHHHERWDGNGYPDGLQGEEIPLLSRIIAVADAYNAMTSDRPYRDALPSRVARLRLAQAVESQFDTAVVAAFEAILAAADEDYRNGTGNLFTLGEREFSPFPSLHEALAPARSVATA